MGSAPEPAAPAGFAETADIETASDGYAARFAGPTGAWFLAVQERAALELLGGMNARSVLDVGGGHGQLAGPLCRQGYAVTVTGSSEACRARIAGLADAGRCAFRVADCLSLPFADASFDAVLSFRLVTHCAAWPRLIGELCRVAGRCVLIDYPAATGLHRFAGALFGAKRRIEGNTRAWRPFSRAEIEAAFAAHGFRADRRIGQFALPMVLHRGLRCPTLSRLLEQGCAAAGLRERHGSPVVVRAVPDRKGIATDVRDLRV